MPCWPGQAVNFAGFSRRNRISQMPVQTAPHAPAAPAPPPEIHKPLQLANPQSRLRFPTMQLNSLIVSKNFSSNPQTSLCTVFTWNPSHRACCGFKLLHYATIGTQVLESTFLENMSVPSVTSLYCNVRTWCRNVTDCYNLVGTRMAGHSVER